MGNLLRKRKYEKKNIYEENLELKRKYEKKYEEIPAPKREYEKSIRRKS